MKFKKIINVNYEKVGHGPNLVCIHGSGLQFGVFDYIRDHLAQYYTVYTFDGRDDDYSIDGNAITYEVLLEDFNGFLENFDLEDVTVLSVGEGTVIAMMAALEMNPRIIRQVFIGLILSNEGFDPEMLEYWQQNYIPIPKFRNGFNPAKTNFNIQEFEKITIPTALFYGSEDMITLEHKHFVNDVLKGSKLFLGPHRNSASILLGGDDLITYLIDCAKVSHLN